MIKAIRIWLVRYRIRQIAEELDCFPYRRRHLYSLLLMSAIDDDAYDRGTSKLDLQEKYLSNEAWRLRMILSELHSTDHA